MSYRESIAEAIHAVGVDSPTAYSWQGQPGPSLAPDVAAAMDPDTARAYLVTAIQARMYSSFYCTGRVTFNAGFLTGQPPGRLTLVPALSRANSGRGAREPGWRLEQVDQDGRHVVSRDGLRLWVRPEELFANGKGNGDGENIVSVLMPKELLRLSPGFYVALGEREFVGESPMIRFYWNVQSEGAIELVELATSVLNEAQLRFRLKVLDDVGSYARCDSGVLYGFADEFDRLAPLVAGIRRAIANRLNDGTPALTKRLAPGLGFAEQPADTPESFGMHRCRLIAEAVVDAYRAGKREVEDQLGAVEERFAQDALAIDSPYLNPDSSDDYHFHEGM